LASFSLAHPNVKFIVPPELLIEPVSGQIKVERAALFTQLTDTLDLALKFWIIPK
jgi:hypothetical protein